MADNQLINQPTSMPNNQEAELSVLGGLLINNQALATIATMLEAEDFYKQSHQSIYRAMMLLFDKNEAIDLVTLQAQLDALDELSAIGGYEYLVELSQFTPSSANIEYYARIVKDKSTLRKLISASQKISQQASQEDEEVEIIVEKSERLILSIGDGNESNRPKAIGPIIKQAFENLIELSENKRDVVGLSSGYSRLDELTTGFHPDQLIIVAARPGVGKTAFALNIAQNVATKDKIPVVIFNLEMGAIDLVNRMICAEGNIDANHLRTGKLTNDEWNSFTVATNTLKDAPIYIDDQAGIRVGEIRAKCRRLKHEVPDLGLIVIDYLQLIQGSGQENRQQEVSDISRQLKILAKELSVPVIALSQLSRSVEQRQDKRPILSDIRESGSIEQDADIVAFLYRDDYYDNMHGSGEDEGLVDNTVEVILAKNRSGQRGTVDLLFKKEYNKFSNLSHQSEPSY